MRLSIFIPIVAASMLSSAEEERKPIRGNQPLPPHTLLASLPDPPEGWKTTRSTAETRVENWMQTYAVRVFEKSGEAPEEGPPPKSTISILDTAKFPGSTELFDDFQPGEEEDYEKRLVENFPAFLTPYGEKEHETILLVGGRFLVTIFIEHQPDRMRKKWIETLDLAALAKVPDGEEIDFPEVVRMIVIDQLNPKRNRTYPLAISEDEAILAEDDEE